MASSLWLSIGLGAGLGLLYVAVSYAMHRRSLRASNHVFFVIALGGIALRLFATLLIVVLILAFVPVSQIAFITSFMGVFFLALIGEVVLLLRLHQRRADES